VQKREKVSQIINLTVASKEVGHYINTPTFIKPTRPMSAIGG
jgi:hypothetical protein